MNSLNGKIALVTGGSAGIGRATAILFSKRGAKVVVASRRIKEGLETVEIIKENGGEAAFIQTDVTVPEQVENLVKKTVETYGRLDIAFNNAGSSGGNVYARLAKTPLETFNQVIDVNLKGVFLCMKYEIPVMQKQGGGVIINNASISGLYAAERMSAYSASKHGVVALTRVAAHEYARENIRVVAVCPGWIRTEIITHILQKEEAEQITRDAIPLGRLGEPEEVAELVAWLASDAASYVTAECIGISGGMNLY